MQWTKSVALALALGIAAPTVVTSVVAEDKPAETKPEAKKEVKGPRLFGNWGKLKSLTAEQRVKMEEIHKKALAEHKKIDDQEETDLSAILTAEQKVELQALKEEEAAKKKAAAEKMKAEKKEEVKKEEKEEKKDGM